MTVAVQPGRSVDRESGHPVGFGGCTTSKRTSHKVDTGASLVAQTVKNLHAVQETWVPSLGQEEPLEKGMATHSSILAWRIPWTEEPGGLQPTGSQRVGHD